jgi:hypothetical protein
LSPTRAILAFAVALPALAQIGYPGGGYPPGQYPGGGGGIPSPFPRRGKQTPGKTQPGQKEDLKTFTGLVRTVDDKSLVVEAADGRVLNFQVSASTKFVKDSGDLKPSELKAGDRVSVDASEDRKGYLSAVTVRFEKAAEKPAAAPGPSVAPVPAKPDADEPRSVVPAPEPTREDSEGRPVLRRRTPAEIAAERAKPVPATEPAASGMPNPPRRPQPAEEEHPMLATAVKPTDEVIERARNSAGEFVGKLPNYTCKEYMARFLSMSHPANWQAQDVVSTDLVYERGEEKYRNLAINGKVQNKGMEQLEGAWSTGEFGTMLIDLFSPATAADFRFQSDGASGGVAARVYNFFVERSNSHWHVQVASQSIQPAYKGSVWIDPKTGRVLRIEMQARQLPATFPLDAVESAVDYQNIRIGAGDYLLPVHAESLSCQRGTSNCSRNAIDFRNYHKYDAESSVTFSDKP